MFGSPIFRREALAQLRRPRTYAFQTLFLAGLVLVLVPLWPAGQGEGAAVAKTARLIFEYGTFFEMLIVALVAPTLTASAITSEKDKHTLELLLLTDAGPFGIVFGKLFARLANVALLLFLSLPVIFALLTLGGIDAKSIGVAFTILLGTAFLGSAIGVFFSTIFRKTTLALVAGYVFMAGILGSPLIHANNAAFASGTYDLKMAYASPWFDLMYLFRPQGFVALESYPTRWWINPLLCVGAGVLLSFLSVGLLSKARNIDRSLGLRQVLEGLDGILARVMGGLGSKNAAEQINADRKGPTGNPIYWKETTVNTLGRMRHWWRVNLLLALLMVGSYAVFRDNLNDIEFHKILMGIIAAVIVLTATMMAATSVAKEREDRTLFVLATTPVDCPTYVKGKVQGILRNISFLMLLPFIHTVLFVLYGAIGWPSVVFVTLSIPVAAISAIVQGTFVSLVFPTTLRAILAAVMLLLFESALPICSCLHTFNPVLLLYYGIEAPSSVAIANGVGAGTGVGSVLFVSSVFSVVAHVLLTSVVFSLMRSGFDRYIGRAG